MPTMVYYATCQESIYEGERFLGVFSSTDLAQKACQVDHERRHKYTLAYDYEPLKWVGGGDTLSCAYWGYQINPITIDEPIVYE